MRIPADHNRNSQQRNIHLSEGRDIKGRLPDLELGVGMVEILVTIFVLAIGLLGVASLQFVGTFTNSDALNRSQSVLIAQQMAERLRANSNMSTQSNGLVVDNAYFNTANYNFENLSCDSDLSNFACFCLTVPGTIPNCNAGNCTSAQFAVFDGYEMSCAIAANNPNVSMSLTCTDNDNLDGDTCSAGSRHTIQLRWPVENWRSQERVLNSECNVGMSSPHDCVVLDVTL